MTRHTPSEGYYIEDWCSPDSDRAVVTLSRSEPEATSRAQLEMTVYDHRHGPHTLHHAHPILGTDQKRLAWRARQLATHGWSRVRVRQAVRGCALEFDADAAARGVSDVLFGLTLEAVVLQAATGRSQGGEVGKRKRTMEGSITWMRVAGRKTREGRKEGNELAYGSVRKCVSGR